MLLNFGLKLGKDLRIVLRHKAHHPCVIEGFPAPFLYLYKSQRS
jgi:hypothetical protein